jgi:hypothetical protein
MTLKIAIRNAERLAPLAAALLGLPGMAWAEANPYYIGVTQTIGHDSNIKKAAGGSAFVESDMYSSTGLVAGFDQPIGRQRVYANASLRRNVFQDFKNENNTGYSLATGLDWSSVEHLSGNVSLGANQSLTYGTLNQAVTEKNIEKNNQIAARVQYGLAELTALEANYSHREVSYSAAAYSGSDLKQNAASLGVKHQLGGQLNLGAALRTTRGHFAVYDFRRDDLDLTASWVPTGASTLSARLSYGRQNNSNSTPDFNGLTGVLSWAYRPTGKLGFTTTLSRDTGAENGFIDYFDAQNGFQKTTGTTQYNRLTTALAISANYAATAKINVNAMVRQSRRKLDGSSVDLFGAPVTFQGSDSLTILSAGATYAPTRNWLLSCSAGRESRTQAGTGSYAYGATSASCSAQFVIQ